MKATDLAAWWGAVIASLVFIWDIVKWWKSRAHLKIQVYPNQELPTDNEIKSKFIGSNCIFVEAVNIGGEAVTLTAIVGFRYRNKLHRLLRSIFFYSSQQWPQKGTFFSANAYIACLPQLLEPGARWAGLIDQADFLQNVGTGEYVYCGVMNASTKKPTLERLRF
jgi:hypothetical protein